jgi:hypothetical protein
MNVLQECILKGMTLEGDRNVLGGIVTKVWLGRFWVQIPVGARDLSLS